jgi:hypothetical protein
VYRSEFYSCFFVQLFACFICKFVRDLVCIGSKRAGNLCVVGYSHKSLLFNQVSL